MSRIHAYVLLGWHFLLHWLKKLFFLYQPGGIDRVRDNFEREGLVELEADEREMLAQWQSCIGCGLCEAACPELGLIPDQRRLGPSTLAQSNMRDLSQADLALPSARVLEECDREQLQTICPVGIPLADLSEFLIRLGARAETASSARQ